MKENLESFGLILRTGTVIKFLRTIRKSTRDLEHTD